jgi:hypothetical protein
VHHRGVLSGKVCRQIGGRINTFAHRISVKEYGALTIGFVA